MSSTFQVVGMTELDAKFEKLQLNATKIMGPAVKTGAKVFQNASKLNVLRMLGKMSQIVKKEVGNNLAAKHVTRTIYNNVEVAARKKKVRGEVAYNTLISRDAKGMVYFSKDGNRSYIPAAIEYGHQVVYYGHKLNKKAQPIPFMRSAYMSHRNMAKEVILNKALKAIEKAAAKKGNVETE